MGLFYEVLSAINNPNQQADITQLATITNSLQQVASSQGIDATQMHSVLSSVGNLVRPALQQQRSLIGDNRMENMISQLGSNGSTLSVVNSLFSSSLQQQIIDSIAAKTGLNGTMIESMLPTILPALVNLLHMGAGKADNSTGNSILNTFLDSDRDGDTDLGDVLKFASRFLKPAY